MLKPLEKAIDLIVQLGGWSVMAAAFLVTYDVITRKLFNASIAGADEISGYIFAVSTACAFSYALLSRANIRIDLLYNILPAPLQRVCDLLSMAMTAGFLAVICYYAYGLAADAVAYGSRSITPLQTPLAIPQTAWVIALFLSVVVSVILLVSAILALLRGRPDEAAALIGIPSLDDEIASELGDGPAHRSQEDRT